MRYLVRLSYDGSFFSGWQIQEDAVTVQGEISRCISTLLRKEVQVTGAGRTDTDVNAINYVAHFDLSEELDAALFAHKLNAILPSGIVIHEISPAGPDFHSRFDAKRREYKYFIHFRKDPFAEKFSWRCKFPLDVEKMNRAAQKLVGTRDFSCFEKSGSSNATSICTVYEARWENYVPAHCREMGFPYEEGAYIVFTVSADRFLRNMVRAIVGTLVDVGRGRMEPEAMESLLDSRDRCAAGQSVPGNALFLVKVEY
ncbi:MAG: tRNA pseudouridine(38-40) synthase TruA [Bacteroidales bacterium]|nr:tRNA pseudouridine(38-40) synthase TruA [Bacteroidales bacterium]